jgi:tRNA(adenine34) deaminase
MLPFTETDVRFMRQALQCAQQAFADEEVPIGAVVVAHGRIIGRGWNQTERLRDPTAHAEMIALTAACETLGGKYLRDAALYVTIEPCSMCASALRWAQLGRLVFGAPEPKAGFSLWEPSLLHPKTEVVGGLLHHEAATLMQEFFAARRKG